nr:hypothetical protein [Tanacetum cinerariifolium]
GHVIFQPYRIFDHSSAVLCLPSIVSSKPRPFKFTNILVHNTRFKEVVLNGWNKYVSGFHMFKVVYKLKCMKKPFRKLMYENGNLHDNVKRLRHELDNVQRDLDRDPFNSILRDEEALYVQAFNDAVLLEELKSRVSRSRIDVVMNSKGVIYENEKVAEALVAHYEMFLGQHGTVIPLCVSNLFQNCLDDVAAIEMIREVSDQEIKDAIFSMGNDKSSGPDGYMVTFFKEAWDIISKDIMLVIREFFVNGKLLKELNHTIIALIPKVSSTARVNDYRPISCCNVLFKYRGPPRCAFKVYIQKAYDTVDWNNLKDILLGFGFHDRLGKRGLRQGDPLSPYLFTLVMEILTLMIRRRVQSSDSFMYHRYCSKLEIVNLCFADDLFLMLMGTRAPLRDKPKWRNLDGVVKPFSRRLKTQDMLRAWDNVDAANVSCALCELQADSHDHLFFECMFSTQVWRKVRVMAGLPSANPSMDSVIHDILPFANRKNSKSVCSKLVLAASAYFIWQERNNRLFRNERRSVDQVVECILNLVRLKLVSCIWKKSKAALSVLNLWKLNSIVLEG